MRPNKRIKRVREKLESKRIGTFPVIYSVFLILASVILQPTLFSYLSIGGICFDSTILVALFLAVYTNEYYGSVFGLALGMLSDMIYPTPFPAMSIVYLVLCAFCGVFFKEMKKGFFIQKISAAIACVGIRSIILSLIRGFTFDDPITYVFTFELPHFVYTVCMIPLFMLICAPAARASSRG